jgi:hypothetical protein
MPRARSTPLLAALALAAIATAACDRHVDLGAIGDGGASVLWTATFERGDLSEWLGDGGGGTYTENVTAFPAATSQLSRRGRYAGLATVAPPMMGMASLNYLFRNQPGPREGYYSAWFYIPADVTVRSWLSLSHFRCSHTGDGNDLFAIWDVNLYPRPEGFLAAHLYNYVTKVNVEQAVPVPVPLATWVHFEVLLRKAADATGRIAVWQDGALILDDPNVATAETDWVQWDAGASSDDVAPTPASIYLDDAAISLSRLGPDYVATP